MTPFIIRASALVVLLVVGLAYTHWQGIKFALVLWLIQRAVQRGEIPGGMGGFLSWGAASKSEIPPPWHLWGWGGQEWAYQATLLAHVRVPERLSPEEMERWMVEMEEVWVETGRVASPSRAHSILERITLHLPGS